jgi:hypothetical protein
LTIVLPGAKKLEQLAELKSAAIAELERRG